MAQKRGQMLQSCIRGRNMALNEQRGSKCGYDYFSIEKMKL